MAFSGEKRTIAELYVDDEYEQEQSGLPLACDDEEEITFTDGLTGEEIPGFLPYAHGDGHPAIFGEMLYKLEQRLEMVERENKRLRKRVKYLETEIQNDAELAKEQSSILVEMTNEIGRVKDLARNRIENITTDRRRTTPVPAPLDLLSNVIDKI